MHFFKLCSAAEREQLVVLQHWSDDSVTTSSAEIGTSSATASSDRPPIRDNLIDLVGIDVEREG